MTGSFKKIDYRLRPAKHVERIMLCDTYRRLRFESLERYQYIGMGSVYFSDFILFHKALGIQSMYSIESVVTPQVQRRFEDNRPFSNVTMLWGSASTVLPTVDLSKKSILWLDYDGRLDVGVLNDISAVTSRISSGSMLTISVQCLPNNGARVEGFDFKESSKTQLLDFATHTFGKQRVEAKWKESDLAGWGTAIFFRELLQNELNSALATRNGVPDTQKIAAKQVIHFHYSDGAYMLTVGWVFHSADDEPIFESCNFPGLDFYRPAEDSFKISLPLLTLRELRSLERQLPLPDASDVELGSIPIGDATKFIALYRYFPNFAITSL